MKTFQYAAATISLFAAVALADESTAINILRAGSQPAVKAPPEYFSGDARIESRFKGSGTARISGGLVSFEPAARTAWHTHPLGQTLFVTAGVGLVQEWGKPIQEIKLGYTVWIPPGVKHWHGASPTVGMTHLAFAEQLDGKAVDWFEKVSDDQYLAR